MERWREIEEQNVSNEGGPFLGHGDTAGEPRGHAPTEGRLLRSFEVVTPET